MLFAALLAAAFAAPPDTKVQLKEIGTDGGQVHRMELNGSGDVLTGRTQRDLAGWLYDLDAWELVRFTPCEVTGTAPVDVQIDDVAAVDIWVSCGDGTVTVVTWDGSSASQLTVDGKPLSLKVDDSLSDIWFDPLSGFVYAVSVAGKGSATVHVIDPFDEDFNAFDAAVSPFYPKSLSFPGYHEGLVVNGTLIVSHLGRGMSLLTLGDNNDQSTFPSTPLQFDCDDLAPTLVGNAYCVDRTLGQVFEYILSTRSSVPVPLGTLSEPEAVCASFDPEDAWLAVTGGQVNVWEMESDGSFVDPPVFSGPADADNPINDMVTHAGYLYGGGPEGGLHVVTSRPWVYPGSVSLYADGEPVTADYTAQIGDTMRLEFQINAVADYAVHVGSNRAGFSGRAELGAGTADADTWVEVEFTVKEDEFLEGTNRIYIVADHDGGLGHARAELQVDNAPGRVQLTQAGLGFGDGSLQISFDGIDDEDLDHYAVYVTTKPWDRADWVTEPGGPDFDGKTELTAPIIVEAVGGEAQTVRISPLENDVTYYIGVRATDVGGKEGPMSTVVSGRPRKTFSAAELAGEEGGTPCSTSGGPLSWLALIGAGALALVRRRRWGALALVALVGSMLAPEVAIAQEEGTPIWKRRDLTPARGKFEVRYGVLNLDDESLNAVYDENPTNLLMVEFGPQIFRILEVDVGIGYVREKSFTVDDAGAASADVTRFTMFPLSAGITLRAHLLDEQPAVPFVRYGFDYAIWSENRDAVGGGSVIKRGAKVGTHQAIGVQLLLDMFQPRRASLLEAKTGINDTWLTVEWRRQRLDARAAPWATTPGGGLEFDGDSFTAGLKLDF